MRFEPAFADYRAFEEQKVAPWRETNDEVKGADGHAGHNMNNRPTPPDMPNSTQQPGRPAPATGMPEVNVRKPSGHQH